MRKENDLKLTKEQLAQMGISNEVADEIVEKMLDGTIPTVNTHAQGGKGGHAISLTYVDNYSTLMLVYTFLLNSYKGSENKSILDHSLLLTLQTVMEEQKQYRQAFLDAVKMLNENR